MERFLKNTVILAFLSLFLFLIAYPSKVFAQTEFWSTPQKLNTALPSSKYTFFPTTVTDSRGYFYSTWSEKNDYRGGRPDWTGYDNNPGIFYTYWNGDDWSTPVAISESDYMADNPAIAVDSDDNIYVVWQDSGWTAANPPNTVGAYWRIILRRKTQAGWQAPVSVSEGLDGQNTHATWPVVAVDSTGTIHVAFSFEADFDTDPSWQIYYTKSSDQGASWTTPVIVGDGIEDDILSLIVDINDNLHLVFETRLGSTLGVKYRRLASGSSVWDTVVPLGDSTLQTHSEYARLAADNNGNVFVAWDEPIVASGGKSKVKASRRSSTGTWWPSPFEVTIDAAYSYWGFPITGVTTDSNGNAYVGWGQKEDDGTVTARYRRWSQSGDTWGSNEIIRTTNDMEAPFIYKDKWDNQHFIWVEESGAGDWEIWYSVVPAAIGNYNPSSEMVLTHPITNDTLTIPANSLASETTISAQIGPLPESYDPSYTTIPRSFTYRPHNTTFINNNTAQAEINYFNGELTGSDERNMRVYLWDGSTSSWSAMTGKVNTGKNFIRIDLAHFSLHGVFTPKVGLSFDLPGSFFNGSSLPVSFNMTYLSDGSPVPAVVEGLLDPQPGSNIALYLKDSSGDTVRTYYSDADGGNQFTVDGANYRNDIPIDDLVEGDYTLEVQIGGTFIGSHQVHLFPVPLIEVNFLFPLGKDDPYIMKEGSTLPVKFSLSQGGAVLLQQEDVTVQVIDSITAGALFTETFSLGERSDNIRFDPTTGQYILNLHTKRLEMTSGEYSINVLVDGNNVGYIPIQLLESGKGKK